MLFSTRKCAIFICRKASVQIQLDSQHWLMSLVYTIEKRFPKRVGLQYKRKFTTFFSNTFFFVSLQLHYIGYNDSRHYTVLIVSQLPSTITKSNYQHFWNLPTCTCTLRLEQHTSFIFSSAELHHTQHRRRIFQTYISVTKWPHWLIDTGFLPSKIHPSMGLVFQGQAG